MTLPTVKVSLSIPDRVFQAAERAAKRMRKSRSRLYSLAIESYLESKSKAAVTKKLDRVYSKTSSKLDLAMEVAVLEQLRRERWD